jgi:hypothetical protein
MLRFAKICDTVRMLDEFRFRFEAITLSRRLKLKHSHHECSESELSFFCFGEAESWMPVKRSIFCLSRNRIDSYRFTWISNPPKYGVNLDFLFYKIDGKR